MTFVVPSVSGPPLPACPCRSPAPRRLESAAWAGMGIVVVLPNPVGAQQTEDDPPRYLERQVSQSHGLPPPPNRLRDK